MKNFDLEKLQNIICEYELPFAVDLKNCFHPEEAEGFIIIIDEAPAQLRVERKYNDSPYESGVILAPFSKIRNDRYGFLSKTKVQVWFDCQIYDNSGIERGNIWVKNEYFLQLSIKYLNKFLMNYRSVTREYWIRPIKKENILNYNYVLLDSEAQQEASHIGLNNPTQFNGGEEITISESKEAALRKSLYSDQHNLADDLLLNAYDNLDLGNFNNTIIQCSILFENFIYTFLETNVSKSKLDKMKKKIECGCLVGIHQVCAVGLKSEFQSDFGDSEEFTNFHKKVLQVRNKLVHGEKLDNVSYENAKSGIDITLAAISKFRDELTK
ncbi:MAG: hypothetical protein Q8J85_06400 [Sulfuricurvum sp.]|nr:hypothetical protein [Sulfuricurvum sp.]MDP3023675.1 hypothetical protein [Sulfuricurvum sp.]